MKEHDPDQFHGEGEFVARAKTVLDRSVGDLDPRTLARLRQARREAFAPPPRRVPHFLWAGGLATTSVAILAAVLWFAQPGTIGPEAIPLEDLEILVSSEELDFYDDLDFYHWLADADVTS